MTVEERILTIQLMEMIKKDSQYAEQIGVEVKMTSREEDNND